MDTTTYDGYAVYEGYAYFKRNTLNERDTVFVAHTPEVSEILGSEGEWAEVKEVLWDYTTDPDTGDTLEDWVTGYVLRYWGSDDTFELEDNHDRLAYVQLKSCECGKFSTTSWGICHPDA